MSKTLKHQVVKVRNSETGEFESMLVLKGESAYETAVRLGTFTGTEEEWNNSIKVERDAAIKTVQDEGITQVSNVQAAAQDIIADREQIAELKIDVMDIQNKLSVTDEEVDNYLFGV